MAFRNKELSFSQRKKIGAEWVLEYSKTDSDKNSAKIFKPSVEGLMKLWFGGETSDGV